MTHQHHGCLHATLSYCKTCDLVWCRGCRREWPTHTWTNKWYPTTTTWATALDRFHNATVTTASSPHTHT